MEPKVFLLAPAKVPYLTPSCASSINFVVDKNNPITYNGGLILESFNDSVNLRDYIATKMGRL
jgi:hypothetical protein